LHRRADSRHETPILADQHALRFVGSHQFIAFAQSLFATSSPRPIVLPAMELRLQCACHGSLPQSVSVNMFLTLLFTIDKERSASFRRFPERFRCYGNPSDIPSMGKILSICSLPPRDLSLCAANRSTRSTMKCNYPIINILR
jgi:hypothetical protein